MLTESKDYITSGTMTLSLDGLFDLLFKAVAHPSIDICGIALDAFCGIAPFNAELSTRLLPYLQGKAIIPLELRNDSDGYEDFMDFRDRFLTQALIACHAGCSGFYLTSCASAIEEFCQGISTPHVPHQLEAALFCMVPVSARAQKAIDKQTLELQLGKIISALKRNEFNATSKRFVMARMCSFISHYASSFAQCQQTSTFEMASELVLTSFNMSVAAECNHTAAIPALKRVSALSEASHALQKLLCCAPSKFSTPTAMAALESKVDEYRISPAFE